MKRIWTYLRSVGMAGFRLVPELKKVWFLSNLYPVGNASCKFRRQKTFPYRCVLLCVKRRILSMLSVDQAFVI